MLHGSTANNLVGTPYTLRQQVCYYLWFTLNWSRGANTLQALGVLPISFPLTHPYLILSNLIQLYRSGEHTTGHGQNPGLENGFEKNYVF